MAFGTADVSRAEDWNPLVVLGLNKPSWPDLTAPRVRLGDVAFVDRIPNGTAHAGALVITGVDSVTGHPVATATERSVPAWTSQGERGLTAGCVLIPAAGGLPALIVTGADAKTAYSSKFVPVRVDQSQLLSGYLWALLSSSSGRESRRRLVPGSARPASASEIANLEIPLPPLSEQRRVDAEVQPVIDALRVRVEKPTPSWSKTADLRSGTGWDLVVKFRDLSVFDAGAPLGELAQVRRGALQPRDFVDRPLPGWLPVIDAKSVRDARATRWAEPDAGTVQPGDIVIPPDPNLDAVLVSTPSVAGANTVAVTANDERDIARIVNSLNSATGRDLRRALSRHGMLLLPQDARRIPILEHIEPAASLMEPVGQQMERLLWP